jgi:hypothetical protein
MNVKREYLAGGTSGGWEREKRVLGVNIIKAHYEDSIMELTKYCLIQGGLGLWLK